MIDVGLFNNIYDKYVFILGEKENIFNMVKNDSNFETSISKLICNEICKGNFTKMFNKLYVKYGALETFNIFNEIFKLHDIELPEDDIQALCLNNNLSSFFESLVNTNDIENEFLAYIVDYYKISSGVEEKIDLAKAEDYFTDDVEKAYIREIRKIPLLTFEEETEIFNRLNELKKDPEKNKEEINEVSNYIVEHNLRLVVPIAIAYSRYSESMKTIDLIQEGNIGLLKSVKRFDVSKGFKFSTYATFWIKQCIFRGLSDKNKIIRLPVHHVELIGKINRFTKTYYEQNGVNPTDEIISKELGVTEEKLKELKSAPSVIASIDQSVNEDEDSTLGDFIENTDVESVEVMSETQDLSVRVRKYLYSLISDEVKSNPHKYEMNLRKVYILKKRFGIDESRRYTLEEISKELGVTKERIRQIEAKALRELNRRFSSIENSNINIQEASKSNSIEEINKAIQVARKNGFHVTFKSYDVMSDKIKVKCNICGKEEFLTMDELLRRTACTKCNLIELENEINARKAEKETLVRVSEGHVKSTYVSPKVEDIDFSELFDEDPELVYSVINTLPPKQKYFLIDKYKKPLKKVEERQYKNLVKRVKTLIKRKKNKLMEQENNETNGMVRKRTN